MSLKSSARLWTTVAAALVIALVAVACGGAATGALTTSSAAPAGSGGGSATSVLIADYAFSPQTLTVGAGTTVTWTNNDPAPHDVVSASDATTSASTTGTFASGNLSQGQTFSFTFDEAGTYYYECTIHAGTASMHGTVVVQ